MKILYITANQRNDFMSDCLFHGFKSLYGNGVVDMNPLWYMYDNVDKSSLVNSNKIHGRGFTLPANIPVSNVDRDDIDNKIKTQYYDLIVYGAIYRCLDKLDLVLKYYPKNKIVFIDGDDVTDIFPSGEITYIPSMCWDRYSIHNVNVPLFGKGIYFKRSMEKDIEGVIPIFFAIPKEKFFTGSLQKNKLLGHIVPSVIETYVFYDEKSYYDDYRQSMFAYTWRKAHWDSLRHGEIIMNKCVPLFLDIRHCPKQSLTKLPKKMLEEVFDIFKGFDKSILDTNFQYDNRGVISNFDFNMFNDLEIDFDKYYDINDKLYTHLLNNLTTEHLAKYVIDKI